MRAETVVEILKDFLSDLESLKIEERFQTLLTSLENLSSAPSPENQAIVKTEKDAIISAFEASTLNSLSMTQQLYTQQLYIEEMALGDFMPSALKKDVEAAFGGNDLTPSITSEKVTEARDKFSRLINESKAFTSASEFFEIYADQPEEGSFDFSISIPRSAVSNELDEFGRELVKLDKLFGVFCEISTGSRDDFKIRSISSSELTVVLESLPAVAVLIATALERISSLYERILNIIILHRSMKESKVPDSVLKDMEKFIQKSLKEEIDEAAKQIENGVLRQIEQARRNQLRTELRNSLKEIASRFDRGYVFDVRGPEDVREPEAEGSESLINAQKRIVAEKRERIRYFKVQDKPILGLTDLGQEPV